LEVRSDDFWTDIGPLPAKVSNQLHEIFGPVKYPNGRGRGRMTPGQERLRDSPLTKILREAKQLDLPLNWGFQEVIKSPEFEAGEAADHEFRPNCEGSTKTEE
jgi:hypothetical protein